MKWPNTIYRFFWKNRWRSVWSKALALEGAFADSKCQVVVSFPLRVSPLCRLAREYVEAGAVGNPVHIAALNYVPYGTTYWEAPYRDYQITGGLFLQKATHDFDYMAYLMGEPIVRVAAMGTYGKVFGGNKPAGLSCDACEETAVCLESPLNRKRNHSGGRQNAHPCLYSVDCGEAGKDLNEDCSSAVVQFASGAHGVYTQVFYARRDAGQRGATVSGYMGTVSFDWYTNELKRVRHHRPFSGVEKAGGGALPLWRGYRVGPGFYRGYPRHWGFAHPDFHWFKECLCLFGGAGVGQYGDVC